jgi:hypothetical protein
MFLWLMTLTILASAYLVKVKVCPHFYGTTYWTELPFSPDDSMMVRVMMMAGRQNQQLNVGAGIHHT